jgi:hypothetical protein
MEGVLALMGMRLGQLEVQHSPPWFDWPSLVPAQDHVLWEIQSVVLVEDWLLVSVSLVHWV